MTQPFNLQVQHGACLSQKLDRSNIRYQGNFFLCIQGFACGHFLSSRCMMVLFCVNKKKENLGLLVIPKKNGRIGTALSSLTLCSEMSVCGAMSAFPGMNKLPNSQDKALSIIHCSHYCSELLPLVLFQHQHGIKLKKCSTVESNVTSCQ